MPIAHPPAFARPSNPTPTVSVPLLGPPQPPRPVGTPASPGEQTLVGDLEPPAALRSARRFTSGGMLMAWLLGIDIGTSGTKTILIDETGRVIARSTLEYPLYAPRPLWSEQDPEDWWTATQSTVNDVLKQSAVDPKEIRGIGLSGQMHGAVFLDSDDQVLRPAILWNDQRTQAECDWIMGTIGREKVVELTSN